MTSTTSMTRLTGMATGLDVDSIVKNTMKSYQMKVDKKIQEKDILEIKQKQYRQILTDTRSFYNKYLDIAKSDSLIRTSNYKAVAFTPGDSSVATATASAGATLTNYTVNVTKLATPATKTFSDVELASIKEIKIKAKDSTGADKIIDVSKGTMTQDQFMSELNKQLASVGMTATHSDISKQLVIATKNYGTSQTFDIDIDTGSGLSGTYTTINNGTNLNATIDNGTGIYTINDASNVTKNQKTVDNVTFNFSKVGTTTLTAKTDVTDIKEKIVNFVNDYNTMITNLNKSIATKHNRNYTPLTEDQKEEMSESEIKLWNEKVEEGQLYRDSDISRITNSLKEAMRSVMDGSGIHLEEIGIVRVKDYKGTANGTFTIDEDKLTDALQNNMDEVVDLFTGQPEATTEPQKSAQTGILRKIENTFDKEVMKSDSLLAQKVGLEGTASFTNNTYTKNILDYENKISYMQADLTRREQLLYSKYANLETMMNNYNSQQSYLTSYFGS